MRHPRLLAVDVGSSHVACALFTRGGDGRLILEQVAMESFSPEPAREERWTEQVEQGLAAIAARTGLGGECRLAVPGHLALAKFIKTPAVEKSKRAKIVQFEAAQNIPYPLDEVAWGHVEVANDGLDLDLMLAAAKTDAMESLCAAADAAGFPPVQASPGCLALFRAFAYTHAGEEGAVMVAEVGARSTHLLFCEQGRFFVRTLTLGGNAVTQAIAEELQLDFDRAEALKLQFGSGGIDLPGDAPVRLAIQRAADAFLSRLQVEVTRSTLNYSRHTGAAAPARVLVTGGGAGLSGLADSLARRLQVPVEAFDATRRVQINANARDVAAVGPRLANLVGLAARLVHQDAPDVSLLPPEMARRMSFRSRQSWLLAAAVLVALAPLPALLYFHGQRAAVEKRTAEIEAELAPVRLIQARNAGNVDRIGENRRQLDSLQRLVATRSSWPAFLADLQERLVEVQDVWLDRLAVLPAPDPASATPLRLAVSGRLLDKNNPLSKVSPDSYERVKKLMAGIAGSRFVAEVKNERFDNSQPGILRFDFTLVGDDANPL